MATYRSPDVYVEEISLFPPSVAEVETAVPAFIGYTEKAMRKVPGDLLLKPTKIYSFKEYEQLFGYARADEIEVTVVTDPDTGFRVSSFLVDGKEPNDETLPAYFLYYAVKMYFDNGGGLCHIVSVGRYEDTPAIDWEGDDQATPPTVGLRDGLEALALEDEPTLIVIPEGARLEYAEYTGMVQAVLEQCDDLRDRFGIFDAFNGSLGQDLLSEVDDPATGNKLSNLAATRHAFGMEHLKYGAVYYPNVRTTLSYEVRKSDPATTNVTVTYPVPPVVPDPNNPAPDPNNPAPDPNNPAPDPNNPAPDPNNPAPDPNNPAPDPNNPAPPPADPLTDTANLEELRTTNNVIYNFVKAALKERFLVMPPSGAVAGVYAATDTSRGVWKAPANVSLGDVLEPVIRVDTKKQDSLNIDVVAGKSINAIRAFAGKGTLVWGARTLAGNDNEWRYISVRRFFNMVEESVKKSTYWAVFEPNDANTWVKVRGMIENYLTQKWREGALAGATPKDAFFVKCGLGTTMSAQDILEGRMNVEIGMAAVRPAEFIVLKFSHKLQTS